MVNRVLEKLIRQKLYKGKAIIILGPRQVGKTTLLEMIGSQAEKPLLVLNCDDTDIRKSLSEPTVNQLVRILGNNKLVLIDEAQRVKNIGLTLKLITDRIKEVQLVVTGSSSLELANIINEPLTGRKLEYQLFPFSVKELCDHSSFIEERRNLETRLVYGSYPDVVMNPGNEQEILKNLASSYLFKDTFVYQDIRKPEFLEQLLEALALQMAGEVSFNELAQLLNTDAHTVQRYIGLLEKAFIIFRIRSFSRNVRNELKRSRKIYFYDNGIRNALIRNYSPLSTRTDQGPLWENYFISERMKYLHYNKIYANRFFWRTTQQQEIDYIEEYNGRITGFEVKWNPSKKVRFPFTFTSNYPDAVCHAVHRDNYQEHLGV
ncbi:MAG: ATP-binding protein [Bacteroidales bacterium]|nr:ATP-binding protein [Bacteroidales bacterium]